MHYKRNIRIDLMYSDCQERELLIVFSVYNFVNELFIFEKDKKDPVNNFQIS